MFTKYSTNDKDDDFKLTNSSNNSNTVYSTHQNITAPIDIETNPGFEQLTGARKTVLHVSSLSAWSLETESLSMIDDEMQVIDTIDQSYWNGKFVPPPPRPPFLEESIAPDGLTTCDLCSWAWQDKGSLSLDGAISMLYGGSKGLKAMDIICIFVFFYFPEEIFTSSDTKEFNWTFALIVVSLTSAFLGAIIMIVFLRCKRYVHGRAGKQYYY